MRSLAISLLLLPVALPSPAAADDGVPYPMVIVISHGRFEDFVEAPPELCQATVDYLGGEGAVVFEVSCTPPLSEFSSPWDCGWTALSVRQWSVSGTRVRGDAHCDGGPLLGAGLDGPGTAGDWNGTRGYAFPFHCRAEFWSNYTLGEEAYGRVRCSIH